MASRTIVLDGHDGVGKSTLASVLARELGGVHIRPFQGQAGINLIRASKNENHQEVVRIGKQSIARAMSKHKGQLIVCDRHWMTILSLLPENMWPVWKEFEPATLCWIDLKTTKQRLENRDEQKFSQSYHQGYLKIYMKMARTFNCHVLRTDQCTTDEAIENLIEWQSQLSER